MSEAPVSVLETPVEPLLEWAQRRLAGLGIAVAGPGEEMRRRDWTLLARIPTAAGPVWAKACARAFAHEGPLLQAMDRLAPGSVLKPLAVHRNNGWFLAPDGGPTLRRDPAERNLFDGPVVRHDPVRWAVALRAYARLQQRLAAHVDQLRDTGVPYLPPSRLVEVYRHYENRAPGLGPAITAAAAALERYDRLSLEHNDLDPGHVFATGTVFFDWGDALITHPFLSLRTLTDPLRKDYFDTWRTATPAEIGLAERLAPLAALHPWRTLDLSPGRPAAAHARFVDELLHRLRTDFGR